MNRQCLNILNMKANKMQTSETGIIVILGSPNSDQSDLYSVAKQRCELGIKEYIKHPNRKILLTGGFGDHFNTTDKPHAYYLKQYLIKRGVPEQYIIDFALSKNTLEDASLSKSIIAKYKVQNIVIITSDYHYDRAKFIFEKEFSDTNIQVHFSVCQTDENDCEFDLKSQTEHEKRSLKMLIEKML